jgi:hypothetical protein
MTEAERQRELREIDEAVEQVEQELAPTASGDVGEAPGIFEYEQQQRERETQEATATADLRVSAPRKKRKPFSEELREAADTAENA